MSTRTPTGPRLCLAWALSSFCSGLAAQPVVEGPVYVYECADAKGSRYRFQSPPDARFSFWVSCTQVAREVASSGAAQKPPQVTLLGGTQLPGDSWSRVTVVIPQLAPDMPTRDVRPAQLRAGLERSSERKAASPRPPGGGYWPLIEQAASRHNLDPHYLSALMHVESAYNQHAVSPKGALGLMQIMPATGRRFGVEEPERLLREPALNIETAAKYLSFLRKTFQDDWVLVTAAYNAGEGAVKRYGNTVPPFRETLDYVKKVERRFLTIQRDLAQASLP